MSIKGKNTKAIRKKTLPNTRNPIVGIKSVKFHHESSGGETYIDLTSLVLPGGMVNPSPTQLTQLRLKTFSESFILMSSAKRGPLMETLAYEHVTETTIKLKFESEVGEIFTGIAFSNIVNGTVIADVRTPGASGDLLEGQFDFNLGEAIPIEDTANNQWPIQLFRVNSGEAKPMLRNIGNAPFAGDHSIGNYEMVDRGDGFCQVVRFNIAGDIGDEPCFWASHGALGERPDLSVLQYVDKISGIVTTMREDLLEVTGFDVTDPTRYDNGVATKSDLQAFGDKVAQLEKILDVEIESTILDYYAAQINTSHNIGTVYTAMVHNLVTVDDTSGGGDEIFFYANEDIEIIATAFVEGINHTNSWSSVRWFDKDGNLISRQYGVDVSVSASHVSTATVPVKVAKGDYIKVATVSQTQGNGAVAFTAKRIVKTKIKDLI